MENIFTRQALLRGSFKKVAYGGIQYGYSFRFATRDTRGIYLSCLEDFAVELDGVKADPWDVTIRVGGGEYAVAQLPELASVVMNLGEAATVKVRHYGELSGKHTLRLSYRGRLPFVGTTGHTLALPTVDEMEVEA